MTPPSSALCRLPSGIQLWPVTSVGWRCGGARGACWPRQLHHLHSAGSNPASGSGRVWGGAAWGARWPRQLHHLHSAGRHPALASGSGRVWCGAVAASGELAGHDNSIICTLQAAVRHLAPTGSGAAVHGQLAGLDNSIICIFLAAVRHPAPAQQGGSSLTSTTPSSALCWTLSGIRLQPGVVWRSGGARGARWPRQLHHLHSAGRRPASGSGRVWYGCALGASWPRKQ